jgi:hypothetical protein
MEAELPQEMIEWKRSFGRASKNVTLSPAFKTFNPEDVSATSTLRSLLGQPILHTYWTECSVRFLSFYFI